MTPISPDQVKAIYAAGKAAVVEAFCRQQAALVEVQKQNEVLGQKVALLEQELARLSKDSSTSHKPPSSDITRAPRRAKPGRGQAAGQPPDGEKRKQGGQPGHAKHNRDLFPAAVVDRVQHYGLG